MLMDFHDMTTLCYLSFHDITILCYLGFHAYINMYMSVFVKLMDVLIIYLISTYVHSVVFKTYVPRSILGVFIIVPFTIWSYIIHTSMVAIQLKANDLTTLCYLGFHDMTLCYLGFHDMILCYLNFHDMTLCYLGFYDMTKFMAHNLIGHYEYCNYA